MRTRTLLAVALSAPLIAQAGPFLIADLTDQTVTHCGFQVDGGARTDIQASTHASTGASKVCVLDLAGISNGQHTANVTAVKNDPVWGRLESPPSVPFVFARPATAPAPSTPRLAP